MTPNRFISTVIGAVVLMTWVSAQPPESKILRPRNKQSQFVLVNGTLVERALPGTLGFNRTLPPTNTRQDLSRQIGGETQPAAQDFTSLFGKVTANLDVEAGLKVNVSEQEVQNLTARITQSETTKAIASGQMVEFRISQSASKFVSSPGGDNQTNRGEQFGPHLLTSRSAATVGRNAEKFLAATKQLKEDLRLDASEVKILRAAPLTNIKAAFDCPYDDPIVCDPFSKYRTFDGSCNNLANPFYGKANTPFERFLPSQYEDGFGEIRKTGSGSGLPLPNPRRISTHVHQASSSRHKQIGVSMLTMTYGQFLSHDVNMNTISRGTNGAFLRCCGSDGLVTKDPQLIELGCSPIEIPVGDPFYSAFDRRCLSFTRALGGTDLKCSIGGREQINQVTHYLDASVVYGSDDDTATRLRLFDAGLLKSDIGPDGRELLLQNPAATGSFSCRSAQGSNHHCFHAGDVRVNQNNNLITLHTLFLREHNRLARELKTLNPTWDDEKLFQEARRIAIAEFQHVTYNEYLPVVLSRPIADFFGLLAQQSGYFTGYREVINPAIRNSFVAAAFRSGHSTIDDLLSPGFDLPTSLNDPTGIYTKGIDTLISDMVSEAQQKMDRYDASSITNRLFEGRPGSGGDLAATNIQRGRDHGLPSYNDFREFCGLNRARYWSNGRVGFSNHNLETVFQLATIYSNPDDVDPWTGMSSELAIPGGVFGPTASCIIALQFNFLKRGDRFYYENNDPNAKFSLDQLNSIRTTTLAKLFCVNTGKDLIARNPLLNPSLSNPYISCLTESPIDLTAWTVSTCVDGGFGPFTDWTPCVNGLSFRYRLCNNPYKNFCGKDCEGNSMMYRLCIFTGLYNNGPRLASSSRSRSPNATIPDSVLRTAKRVLPKAVFNN